MRAVEWLVDRMHVGTSDVTVVRDMARRMAGKGYSREQRKEVYREALNHHRRNQQLYRDVMRGNL
jgi:hypothetical protein